MYTHDFYRQKRVFVTGHMGFKGTWLSVMLQNMGAQVLGYGIRNQVEPSIYDISGIDSNITSVIGDVRDYHHMQQAVQEFQPEIILHLAAQPIVLTAYENPVYTYETNVLGTVNLMECIRHCESVKSVVNVTTDKVYRNQEMGRAFKETDELNGLDPYSNSKSCSELVTSSFIESYFQERNLGVSTVRAGNVIGGGDFSENRILPDCIRAQGRKEKIHVRNPYSVRPYQHVLEALGVYLMVAEKQYLNPADSGAYNVGPNEQDCISTGEMATLFCKLWGENASWESDSHDEKAHKEAGFLTLNCEKLKKKFQWEPKLTIEEAVKLTVQWQKEYENSSSMMTVMRQQIEEYESR